MEMRPVMGPLSIPQMKHEQIWSGGTTLTGEGRRTQRETCFSGTSSTTDTTTQPWTGGWGLPWEAGD